MLLLFIKELVELKYQCIWSYFNCNSIISLHPVKISARFGSKNKEINLVLYVRKRILAEEIEGSMIEKHECTKYTQTYTHRHPTT